MMGRTTFVVALASLLVIACGDDSSAPEKSATPEPGAQPAPPPPPPADPLPGNLNLPGSGGGAPASTTPPPTADATFMSISADGSLVRFQASSAAKVSSTPITGLLPNESVVGIDFRPKDKKLFALGSSSRLYTINVTTAVATEVGPELVVALRGSSFGFNFDPMTDLARVFSDLDQNIAVDPVTGWIANDDLPLAFVEGDLNAAKSPTIVASAYASGAGKTSPPLYAIDGILGVLTMTTDPGSGLVETVGALDVANAKVSGLDIDGSGKAFAVASDAAETALYTIDLKTGHATKVAKIGVTTALRGLAIQP